VGRFDTRVLPGSLWKGLDRRVRTKVSMNRLRSLLVLGFVAQLIASTALGDTSASMQVSVEVVARTIMTIEAQPASVEISAGDVARGYIELPAAVTVRVRSNARSGYAIEFAPLSGPFNRAKVRWSSFEAAVTASEGSWVVQPQAKEVQSAMAVRLIVSQGTQPGSYAWPLVIDAKSL
jgi:hypothetical protein